MPVSGGLSGLLTMAGGKARKGVQWLIGPVRTMCTCCGKGRQYEGWNPLEVCQRCFEAIPWITNVECPVCGRGESCPDCSRQERTFSMNRSVVRYNEDMRDLLARYKYRGEERLQLLLGRMLVHGYRQFMAISGSTKPFHCITFVPVSRERQEERGFNQAEQMARVLAELVQVPVIPLLDRIRHTDKQSLKSREERMDNLSGAFALQLGPEHSVTLRSRSRRRLRILLVDDVYTTGSTLDTCAKVIRRELPTAEVYGLSWAR